MRGSVSRLSRGPGFYSIQAGYYSERVYQGLIRAFCGIPCRLGFGVPYFNTFFLKEPL